MIVISICQQLSRVNLQFSFKLMKAIVTILLATLFLHSYQHTVLQIDANDKEEISAYVNQAKSIIIPFLKCFKAQPELQRNSEYLDFKPTRLGLHDIKSYPLKGQGSHINVMEQLRNPTSYKHRHIIIFNDYLMVFFAPNVILIIEENSNGFTIKNKYYLQDLKELDQFKIYKLGDKALMVIYNTKKALLLNTIDYEDYTLPYPSSIIHLQELQSGNQFIAAQFRRGLSHYKLDQTSKTISIVKSYKGNDLGLGEDKFTYVVDVNLMQYKEGVILALDAELGLVQIQLSALSSSQIIVSQKMCESFDSIDREHIVMLCQNQGHSTIVEAYRYFDTKTKTYKYRKVEPIFHSNYLNDLHLTWQYYLVYSYSNIHVFWNTQKNRLPESLQTQSQIVIPGLETFTLQNQKQGTYMYTVEDGELKKYELNQEKASLKLSSKMPIEKEFKLYIYGSCNDLSRAGVDRIQNQIEACRVAKQVHFKAIQEDYPREGDVGISATIIIILILVFLIVIWICLTKYKGLEREARKVLESYQKRKSTQRRPI